MIRQTIILPRQARDKHRGKPPQKERAVCVCFPPCRVSAPFSHHSRSSISPAALVRNTPPFPSSFPMFVPSLSWQNDRFYLYIYIYCSKRAFLAGDDTLIVSSLLMGMLGSFLLIDSSPGENENEKNAICTVSALLFILKVITLPRQARDKHRKSGETSAFFLPQATPRRRSYRCRVSSQDSRSSQSRSLSGGRASWVASARCLARRRR